MPGRVFETLRQSSFVEMKGLHHFCWRKGEKLTLFLIKRTDCCSLQYQTDLALDEYLLALLVSSILGDFSFFLIYFVQRRDPLSANWPHICVKKL